MCTIWIVEIETTIETMLYTKLHYNEFHSEPKHKNNVEFDSCILFLKTFTEVRRNTVIQGYSKL